MENMMMMDKKMCLHTFLCSTMSEEIEGGEDYLEYAEIAKELGEGGLANMLLTHAKQELKHYSDLKEAVEASIQDIARNPLYPLFEDLEEWAEKVAEGIEDFAENFSCNKKIFEV